MGKTSGNSKLNLPGKFAWITMEVPGFLSLIYSMTVLPARLGISDLPLENKVLGSLYVSLSFLLYYDSPD
jgi:3-oxo-5-alpha-steroid 4-dehydrogenase 1